MTEGEKKLESLGYQQKDEYNGVFETWELPVSESVTHILKINEHGAIAHDVSPYTGDQTVGMLRETMEACVQRSAELKGAVKRA